MYTNKGLVEHAKKALADKTKYMWGGIYRPITENYIQMLRGIYGTKQYPDSRINELRKFIGKGYYGIDCVGLVKSYYWSGNAEGGRGSKDYGKAGYPDVNATAMFNAAKEKGTIDTLPEIPGLVLYSKIHPHVGVYIGNGYVIESTLSARGDGVTKAKVSGWSGWTHWFKCPYIEYEKAVNGNANNSSANKIKVGSKVTVKRGAKTYTGGSLASFVYKQTYTVMEIKGDRVVIGQNGKVTAAVKASDLNGI